MKFLFYLKGIIKISLLEKIIINKTIKVMCPAKINLYLKVFKKDENNFHKIESIMQSVNLFDYLTIGIKEGRGINLSGNSSEIPYSENNICYSAAKAFLDYIKKDYLITIDIQKNIPVCAGLAGGSSDCAGVLVGLNHLFNNILSNDAIHNIARTLGSDINFCLEGGTKLCLNYGDKLVQKDYFQSDVTLVKPKDLKISAKEAYSAFDKLNIESDMKNDLEFALLKDAKFPQLKYLSSKNLTMSGSGPTFFTLKNNIDFKIDEEKYLVINNLKTINHGVKIMI